MKSNLYYSWIPKIPGPNFKCWKKFFSMTPSCSHIHGLPKTKQTKWRLHHWVDLRTKRLDKIVWKALAGQLFSLWWGPPLRTVNYLSHFKLITCSLLYLKIHNLSEPPKSPDTHLSSEGWFYYGSWNHTSTRVSTHIIGFMQQHCYSVNAPGDSDKAIHLNSSFFFC